MAGRDDGYVGARDWETVNLQRVQDYAVPENAGPPAWHGVALIVIVLVLTLTACVCGIGVGAWIG